jgi:hypothetical protein
MLALRQELLIEVPFSNCATARNRADISVGGGSDSPSKSFITAVKIIQCVDALYDGGLQGDLYVMKSFVYVNLVCLLLEVLEYEVILRFKSYNPTPET